MAEPRLFITRHALSRFIKRHAPHMSESQARVHLEQAAATAVRLQEKTLLGQDQWGVSNPQCVLVMKEQGNRMICVTVLPEPEAKPKAKAMIMPKRAQRRRW